MVSIRADDDGIVGERRAYRGPGQRIERARRRLVQRRFIRNQEANPLAQPLELLLGKLGAAQEAGAFGEVGYSGELEDARKRAIEPTTIFAKADESLQIGLVSVVSVEPQVNPYDVEQSIDDGDRLPE